MKLRSLVANLALALGVSLALLALLEGAGRLFAPPPQEPQVADYLWDWEEHWEGEFYTLAASSAGWPPGQEINGDGLRDRPHAEEKPEGVLRLVFLGDSVTFGDGVEARDAYPQTLQRLFDAEGRPVEVFNIGLWGWSTRQHRLAWERIARRYAPDRVVVAVCLNDIPEMHNNLRRPSAWLSWLYERSAFVRWVVGAPGREIRSVEQLFDQPDAARVREGYRLFFEELRTLRAEVEASGARLGLMVFPFRFQVRPGAPEPMAQREIAAFAAAEELPFLDLLPVLRPLGDAAFVDYDHLSPRGAAATAAAVADSALLAGAPESARALLEREGLPGDAAALAEALAEGEPDLRQAAAWGLGRSGAEAAVGPLAAALARDPRESVRSACARALAAIGGDAAPARPALLDALGDERQAVRWAAAEALHSVGVDASSVGALARVVDSPDTYVRAFATWTLGGMGPAASPAVPRLAAVLRADGGPGRAGAAAALTRLGPAAAAAVPALVEELSHPRPDRRWRAARALGRIGPGAAAAAPALAQALDDDEARVRRQAARALGRLGAGARPVLDALVRSLEDADPSVRQEAVDAMSRIPGG